MCAFPSKLSCSWVNLWGPKHLDEHTSWDTSLILDVMSLSALHLWSETYYLDSESEWCTTRAGFWFPVVKPAQLLSKTLRGWMEWASVLTKELGVLQTDSWAQVQLEWSIKTCNTNLHSFSSRAEPDGAEFIDFNWHNSGCGREKLKLRNVFVHLYYLP